MIQASPRLAVRIAAGTAAAAMVCAGLSSAPAQATTDLGKLSDYVQSLKTEAGTEAIPNKWFVQVAGSPSDDGGSKATVKANQESVKNNARSRGLKVEVTRSFSTSFNGLTVNADDATVAELLTIPNVVKVFPVVQIERPVTTGGTSTPDMASAINLSGAAIAQNELGLSGKGIKVGIMDTGVDFDHPDFGGNGTNGSTRFPTAKVAYGYDFVGDDYDAENPGARPVPDAIPDDCEGHGTHVAGIAAADGDTTAGGIKGVAPKATLGAYRVFGCTGSTDSDIMLAAMERAGIDGMDVLNMSIGSAFSTWPDYPTAQAADRLQAKGVVVVASAGNSGQYGLFSTGAPGIGNKVIGVASFDNSHVTQNVFTTSNGQTIGYGNASGSPVAPTSGSLKVAVAPGDGLGCTALPTVPDGTVYLIKRGTCAFHAKAANAQAAGADAVILYNNAPGTINPTVEGTPTITIPVVMISQADGAALAAAAAAGEVTMTWTSQTKVTPSATGGLISDFSSWGLTANLQLKPDLGAPGGDIWSTVPVEQGGHASNSGTSMSSPHVAGAVALLLEGRPELKGHPTKVREILQNTSSPAKFSFLPNVGLYDMVARQGAGMIDVSRAVLSEKSVSPSKISLGERAKKPVTTKLMVTNDSDTDVTYTITNLDGVGAVGPSDPDFYAAPATFSAPGKVTVAAGEKAAVKVTISEPADIPNGYIYGGWVVLTGDDGSVLRVPYAGMAGDYQAEQALYPYFLGYLDGDTYYSNDEGYKYSMQGADVPYMLFHLEYPVSDLALYVYKANADGSKGALLSDKPVVSTGNYGRDSSYTALTWDGTYSVGKGKKATSVHAESGSYILELRALKALGDPKNPDHWEIFTSPAFTIGSGEVDPGLVSVQSDANKKVHGR